VAIPSTLWTLSPEWAGQIILAVLHIWIKQATMEHGIIFCCAAHFPMMMGMNESQSILLKLLVVVEPGNVPGFF
jgi:hypothetical protein